MHGIVLLLAHVLGTAAFAPMASVGAASRGMILQSTGVTGVALQPIPASPCYLHGMAAPASQRSTTVTMAVPWDGILGVAGWLVIYAYQVGSKRLTAAWASRNGIARAVWTRYILEKGDYILGVQTLRNALTAASFFASACFTMLTLLIGIASRNPAALTRLVVVKFGITALLLVGAALSYLESVRYMNTCAFLFQVANDRRDETCSGGTVMLLMVLSQNSWAAGERMLYMLVPAVTWLVGGGGTMLALSIGALPLLYFKDLPPPTNLLDKDEPSLVPYQFLLPGSRLSFLDIFGFQSALTTAQTVVASSGDYVRDRYGYEPATWPPR